MLGGGCAIQPAAETVAEKKALIRNIARAAVFLRAQDLADRRSDPDKVRLSPLDDPGPSGPSFGL
ncbi:hypothetical protein [Streptomyces sp. NBC_00005]|uniref:hypothetical protein n=1 Tax=Streptomyces sp. NBC_00005 TaxID=2903609 RepID=UPI0032537FFC